MPGLMLEICVVRLWKGPGGIKSWDTAPATASTSHHTMQKVVMKASKKPRAPTISELAIEITPKLLRLLITDGVSLICMSLGWSLMQLRRACCS